ncbi:MAG: AAA family ATPase [Methanobacterium sp.]
MVAVLITGTPGTGKTTVSKIVAKKLECPLIAVNDLVVEKQIYNGYDEEKGYKVVDLHALSREIKLVLKYSNNERVIVEGHLAHYFDEDELVETVIVLRSRPDILRKRLDIRKWNDSKIRENLEAEALDICTFEAVEIHGQKVNELDTSDLSVEDVAELIIEILDDKKYFPPGKLNFLEDYMGET